jgi:hypothetical protein
MWRESKDQTVASDYGRAMGGNVEHAHAGSAGFNPLR